MVTVTAGGRHRVDAVLVARSAIRGIVTLDQPGFPPGAGVRVRLFLEDFPSTAIRTTTADANGFYEFVGLDAPAAYIVDFTPPPVTPARPRPSRSTSCSNLGSTATTSTRPFPQVDLRK